MLLLRLVSFFSVDGLEFFLVGAFVFFLVDFLAFFLVGSLGVDVFRALVLSISDSEIFLSLVSSVTFWMGVAWLLSLKSFFAIRCKSGVFNSLFENGLGGVWGVFSFSAASFWYFSMD